MALWSWWLGAIGLAGTAVGYLILMGRPLGASGVVNTVLDPMARQNEMEMDSIDDAALEQAMLEATRAQFGDLGDLGLNVVEAEAAPVPRSKPLGYSNSWVFLLGIVLGGAAFALVAPGSSVELQPAGIFLRLFGGLVWPALFVGGVLVGVGTSMAGGCTSGHGLVGCGRLQPASLVATACFSASPLSCRWCSRRCCCEADSVVLGALFGFVVSAVGFTNYDEVFAMFTFTDLRMFLSFAGAVVLSAVAYRLLRNARPLAPRRMHKGVVIGGLLFGVGWVVSGACPGVAFAQFGQGKVWALVTLVGIAVGTVGFRLLNQRSLHMTRDSCG